MITEGVDGLGERGMMEEGSAAKGTVMPKPNTPSRLSVTSDPDRGVAVNSGTDPQRPGKPARAIADTSAEKTAPVEDSAAAQRPASRNEDVEHGGRNEPDDPV
jgi:hypothetical protein